jgi:hypothetical protein
LKNPFAKNPLSSKAPVQADAPLQYDELRDTGVLGPNNEARGKLDENNQGVVSYANPMMAKKAGRKSRRKSRKTKKVARRRQ